MKMNISPWMLITSCGGPASTNVILNMNMIPDSPMILGIDMNPYMIKLSKADRSIVCSRATDEKDPKQINIFYKSEIDTLSKLYNIQMLYPQSDVEVYIASRYRKSLPPTVLPSHYVIERCQDKGNLYDFLTDEKIKVPYYANIRDAGCVFDYKGSYPCWARARKGAGGNKGFICRSPQEMANMIYLCDGKDEIRWQMVELLNGKNYSWTSLWNNGMLVTSVLKERLQWVYNRIGTTAVQRTVHDMKVNSYCKDIVETLAVSYDRNLTGIMMIDLKADCDGNFYITEVNSGRLGTVNYNYGLWSREYYGDDRLNFPWLLWNLCTEKKLPDYYYPSFNPFPENVYYARHIDMGYKSWKE